MTIGSLFSGIGGLEYGLEAAGFGPVLFQVEIDAFCRKVLAKHWPDADRSITNVHHASAKTLPCVDMLCGGFPCVETSSAGTRKGMDGDVSGPLWREYKRVIDELRPRVAVVENVASGATRWLCAVRTDLHQLGYDTAALAVSAEDVGAPHRRKRIFVVALAHPDAGRERQPGRCLTNIGRRARDRGQATVDHAQGINSRGLSIGAASANARPTISGKDGVADTEGSGLQGGLCECPEPALAGPERRSHAVADAPGLGWGEGRTESAGQQGGHGATGGGPPQHQPGRRHHGRRDGDVEPGLGRESHGLFARLDGHRWPAGRGEAQHEEEPPRTSAPRSVPDRSARVKALGNAVVPQCGLVVGRWIREVLG